MYDKTQNPAKIYFINKMKKFLEHETVVNTHKIDNITIKSTRLIY